MSKKQSDPSVTQQVKFDAICIQFEQALRQGEMPVIEAFLDNASEAERPLLLPQLLLLELEYREEADVSPKVDDYLVRFPNEPAVVRGAFDEHAEAIKREAFFDENAAALAAASPSAKSDVNGTLEQPPISERPGSQIGRYKLLEQIGEGGMGVVYMAEQQRPVRRKVALKIIKPGMDTKQVVARFEAERQALAMMDHTNIARVFDAGSTESGRPFFVMELVRGVSITEYCDQAKLDTNARLKLFMLVCQAVQHAHTKGIIHRDLKPSNVLVTLHDGVPVPKIIDFGVSKAMGQQLTERTMFTAFAQMVGTPLYMSPEQAEMSGLDIDTRSDIYSLGVLLYELLTGVTPFDRRRLHTAAFDELRRIIREEEPDKPSTRVSTMGESGASVSAQRSTDPGKLKQLLRGELDWIVMKTLEKDRNRRYETANALVAELNRYLNGDPVEACPPSATYRLRKFARRYQSQVAVAGSFCLLLLASSVLAWFLYADARRARKDMEVAKDDVTLERDRAIEAEQKASRERDRAESEKQRADHHASELQSQLYDYTLNKAQVAFRGGDNTKVQGLLTDCLEEQRGWEWHRLNRLTGGERKLRLGDSRILAASPNPVAPQIAIVDADGNLRLCDLNDGRTIWSRPTEIGPAPTVEFSQAGGLIGVGTEFGNSNSGKFEVWEATGQTLWEASGVFGQTFSADDRYVAYTRLSEQEPHTSVVLQDLRKSKPIWQQPCDGTIALAAFDQAGEHLFLTFATSPTLTNPTTISCWTVEDHTEIWSVRRETTSFPLLTADGLLVFGTKNHSLEIRDPSTGKIVQELESNATDLAFTLKFSPDGRYISSFGDSGQIVVWDWQERKARPTVHQNPTPGLYAKLGPAFSHDSQHFAQATGSFVQLTSLDPAPAEVVLAGHEQTVRGVSFTPDGKQVISSSFDGTVRRWDAATGQERQTNSTGHYQAAVAYSHDGLHVATSGPQGGQLWSSVTGTLVQEWPEPEQVYRLELSPDGKLLVACNTGKVLKVLEIASGREVFSQTTELGILGAVFSADGKRVITLTNMNGQLDVWDVHADSQPQQIRPAGGAGGKALLRITPSRGSQLPRGGTVPSANRVAAGIGNSIELWDIDTGRHLSTLRGHATQVACFAASDDGKRLFSGDYSGTVIVWNLDTGEQLLTMQTHEPQDVPGWPNRGVYSMALSPDGETLATTGADGLVKLWETGYPLKAVIQQRRIVEAATQAVDQRYRQNGSVRAVLESLTGDTSLRQEVLAKALEIANSRGNRLLSVPAEATPLPPVTPKMAEIRMELDEGRQAFVKLIKAALGSDLGKLDESSRIEVSVDGPGQMFEITKDQLSLDETEFLIAPLIDTYPDAHQFLGFRGYTYGHHGQWKEAEADLTAALERVPDKTKLWHIYAFPLAFLHARLGNVDRYRKLCEKALLDFHETSDPQVAEEIANMCQFSQLAPSLAEPATRMADRAMEVRPDTDILTVSMTTGVVQCRHGNSRLAIDILQSGWPVPSSLFYQSLAHLELGQPESARDLLSQAERKMNSMPTAMWWVDSLASQMVRDELKQLLAAVDGASPDNAASEGENLVVKHPAAELVIPRESIWKWMHPADGVDPAREHADFHSTFFLPNFDDSDWKSGRDSAGPKGGFGYGDPVGVEFKLPAEGQRKTAYLRHRFTTQQAYDDLVLSMQRDDGVIIYLDGNEVRRCNLKPGAEAFDLFATHDVSGRQETWLAYYQLPGRLEPGDHVLAISLHNSGANSDDLRIAELSLWGTQREAER